MASALDWLRRERLEEKPQVVRLADRNLPIRVRRHARAKRMTLRLADDGEAALVTIPRWGRPSEAIAFAQSRANWLDGLLAKRPVRTAPMPGGTIYYRGEPLAIAWDEQLPRRITIGSGQLRCGGPAESLAPRIERWLKSRARALLKDDLVFYTGRAGLETPPLSLSSARRRWGSCSSAGAVRINWRLIQAPDAVRRSVVAHEVAHLVHFDHSPAFHRLLAQLYEDDLWQAEKWLKAQGPTLFAQFG